MDRSKIFDLVVEERHFQNNKWQRGDYEWVAPLYEKLGILTEELGEVATGVNDKDLDNVLHELVQVMATACAWIESEY